MAFDTGRVQSALAADGVDGWLLYDFHGSNPIARRLAGLDEGRKMTTRRWFYLVPASGTPTRLVHAIESHVLDHLPGRQLVYAAREQLEHQLTTLLSGHRRVAMEYSPDNAIPYVSRVDAGTVEAVRRRGVEVVSSGDLVQRFEARWSDAALAMHLEASARLYRIKDRAFEWLGRHLPDGVTEFDLQEQMVTWFGEEQLVSDARPMVAAREHAADPHYQPTRERHRGIGWAEVVLLDLWGKLRAPGAVYADISWVGFTGTEVPAEVTRAFAAVAAARDAAAGLVQDAIAAGRDLRGFEVDRAARRTLEDAGYADRILHRTGHSLGEEVHGNGVHMDDYETHDDRRLLPGTGFTIEPGVYLESFGIRSEINMFVGDREARVSGPIQSAVIPLA